MLKWFISSRTYFNTLLVHTACTSLALVALTWPFAEPTRLSQSRGRTPRRHGRGRGGTAAEEGGGPGRGGAGCAGRQRPLQQQEGTATPRCPAPAGDSRPRAPRPLTRQRWLRFAMTLGLVSLLRKKATNNSFCIALTRIRSSARHLTKTKKIKALLTCIFCSARLNRCERVLPSTGSCSNYLYRSPTRSTVLK